MAEIYKSGRKTYVADRNFNEMYKAARRYFHTTSANILIFRGWEFEDGLYFEDPHRRSARMVWVAAYSRKAGTDTQLRIRKYVEELHRGKG